MGYDIDYDIFAKRLKETMREKGKSIYLLGAAADISYSAVSRYANGQMKPKSAVIQKFAEVLDVNDEWLMGQNVPKERHEHVIIRGKIIYPVPIYEKVSAGVGTSAIDEVVGHVLRPFSTEQEAKETICIRVTGDSMSPSIQDGDLVQVHLQSSVDNGDIAVVLVDGEEGLVKKVIYKENLIKLVSLNLSYEPIVFKGPEVQRCRVIGKVKNSFREY